MKQGYVLNLYYNSLKNQAQRVEKVKKIVQTESGGEWKVLGYGDHILTIGFFSATLNREAFHRDMGAPANEEFCYLLLRTESVAGYHIYGTGAEWFAKGLAQLAAAR